MPAFRRTAAAVLVAGGLAACQPVGPVAVAPAPQPAAPAYVPSAESRALQAYYAQVQATLVSRGLMRTDGGQRDAPFNARMLAENFIRIAMYDEFVNTSAGYVQRETESVLRRWQAPVRVSLRFGASVDPARRAAERSRVTALLARLSSVTGHPIRLVDGPGNFLIYLVDEDERRALGPELAAAMPGFSTNEIAAFTAMPSSTYCQVSVVSDSVTGVYQRALAVMRTEHPGLLHLACLHEEIAQGLGLPNDSARARPSVFNDDQEFALLTPMDEAMLRILYNPALRPGMTIAEARPIVEALARGLAGGES